MGLTGSTISSGAAPSNLEAGTYELTFLDIDEEPRTIHPQRGPQAGQAVDLFDWRFVTDDDEDVSGATSTASGPKSKQYAWLTALLGGKPPAIGAVYSRRQDGLYLGEVKLSGRRVIGTVDVNDGGFANVVNLSALPTRRGSAQPPVEAPGGGTTPSQGRASRASAQQPVAVGADADGNLPF